jgi:hypothetical protein
MQFVNKKSDDESALKNRPRRRFYIQMLGAQGNIAGCIVKKRIKIRV